MTARKNRSATARRSRHHLIGLAIALIVIAFVALIVPSGALGADHSVARSVAMGGAYIGLARGTDAAKFNPANLGLTDYHQTGIELVGVGANISNNAFNLSDYNRYTGAFLTDDDKQDILDKIPTEGLKLDVDVQASALSMAFGSYAVNVAGVGVADVNLSKDIFELVFNGNTFADTIDVTGSYSDVYAYASAGFSYGMPIYGSGTRQLSVGATFKYIRGIAIEQVVELQGMAATYATGFAGEGKMIAQTATGGRGYALDLGAALQLNSKYTVGARIENFLGSIQWDHETEEHGYIFNFDTMTVDNMGDDYVVSDDYSKPIGSFTTRLPASLTIGLARTSGRLLWAVDWTQGLQDKPGQSTTPEISAGVEYSPLGFLPLRAGFTAGGKENTSFSFGSGFDLPLFYLDYAVVTGSSLSGYSSKGLNFAISMGLHF
jgi:hypothetical protein